MLKKMTNFSKHKKGGNLKRNIIIILSVLCSITFAQTKTTETRKPNAQHYTTFAKKFQSGQFSPDEFKKALGTTGLPLKHIDEIYNHARRESGNFKSKVFRENNNAFGMRLPRRRTTTAVGRNRGYAIYDNWYDSVYDYWLWYDNKPIKDNQSWGTYLRSRNYMNPNDRKK